MLKTVICVAVALHVLACDEVDDGVTRIPIGTADGAVEVDGGQPDGTLVRPPPLRDRDARVADPDAGERDDAAAPDPSRDAAGDDPDVGRLGPDAAPLDPDAAPPPELDAAPPEPDAAPPEPDAAPAGLALLGNQSHAIDRVEFTVIADARDGLATPRDLAFNPENPGELWIVNRRDDSVTVLFDAPDSDAPRALHRVDPYALHFMEEVSSIDFGAPQRFGTCQESRNTYNDRAPPNDFMGPALWSSDLDVFGRTNPDAVDFLGADLGSHLDMLHESPLCMGIVWERDNRYFIFEGMTNSLARADFRRDHGPGFDDHSDGIMERFAVGEVRRVRDVPSHLLLEDGLLYIADTGNGRVATLDVTSGQRGPAQRVIEPGTQLYLMLHDDVETLFDHPDLERPSGLARLGAHIFVSDNATGRIWAIDDRGEVVDYLDTGLPAGALMGLAFDASGDLYGVDAVGNRAFRISAR